MSNDWKGIFPAATTQFRADQSVDLEATKKHVRHLLNAKMDGLIMLGSLGENAALDANEKLDVLRAVVEVVGGQIPVLATVAECSTRAACRFAEEAANLGADGLMVLPAMIYRADTREAITHFRAVASATSLPIMLYNNPIAYRVDVTPAMFAELADEKKFVAIKESSDDIRRVTDLKNICGDRYRIFCGVDDLILEGVMLGCDGYVAGLVDAFPAETRLLWDLAKAGKFDEAVKLYRWFTPLLHLDTHIKFVQFIKLAMAELGLGSETVRAPRLPIVGEERERILKIIRHAIATRREMPR